MPTRVLVDLSHAADGFVGIAQDIRLVFEMLAGLPGIDVSGLLMPQALHDLPPISTSASPQTATAAGIVHWMSQAAQPANHTPRRSQVAGRLRSTLREVRRVLRTRHHVLQLPPEMHDAVWRVLFAQTLPPTSRPLVLARPFLGTDLSVARLLFRTGAFPRLSPMSLDLAPHAIDAVLFCNARPIRLPQGGQTLIRYHDAIPRPDPDMGTHWQAAATHQRMVQACVPGALFICDTPASVADLTLADPSRAAHARVIPCALAPIDLTAPLIPPATIFAARRTFRALAHPIPPPPIDPAPRYVLSVSTFEPRKNFTGLVRAWERVTARHDPALRLVLVAGRGWLEEEGLRLIAPHVEAGRIVHLQGLPPDELQSLLRQAACFAFPSFAEGFGLPPLEALQAGTPVIVSDLPVFRWTLGGAALYIDPYDTEALAEAIARLCTADARATTIAQLQAAAPAVIDRFRPTTVARHWAAMLDELPSLTPSSSRAEGAAIQDNTHPAAPARP